MTLSLTKLSQALLEDNIAYKLIRYINDVQRFDLKRLDFEAAAEATGSSSRTVYRTVKRLAEKQILVIEGDKLRINECMAIS